MNGSHCTADAIQSFIDGDLTRSELKAAAAHLRVCAACRSQYEFILRFDDAVKSLPMSGTGEGFTDSVMAKLDFSLPAPRAFHIITWMAYQIGLLVVAAVMVGVFIMTGLIQPEQFEAGRSMAGEALGSLDSLVAAGAGALAGLFRMLIPVPSAGSLAIVSATALVLLMLLVVDRNFSKKPLHRTR